MHTEQEFTSRQYMKNRDFEFFHYRDEPTLEIDYHNHDFYEIYFFISGKVTYIIEGSTYILKPGDILLINDREIHKPIIEKGCIYERYVIWVNPDFLKRHSTERTDLSRCFEIAFKNKCNLLRPGANTLDKIKNVVFKLNSACTDDSYGNDILRHINLLELLICINTACMEDPYGDDIFGDIVYSRSVNEVIRFINENLDGDLSLDTLSKKFYTSKYHLLREFKKYTGYTPYEYALRKRLINARKMLKEGYRISEICRFCGFGDYSNFSRAFRKVYNISPKQYRKYLVLSNQASR